MIGDEVRARARAWIGTPYLHQASLRGAGADCLGLVRGIWREIYGAEPESLPAYTGDWAEPGGHEVLWSAAGRHLLTRRIDQTRAGDVLLFRMRAGTVAKHIGIAAETGAAASFVHAYSRHGVVESPLSAPWARRVVACFSFPDRRV